MPHVAPPYCVQIVLKSTAVDSNTATAPPLVVAWLAMARDYHEDVIIAMLQSACTLLQCAPLKILHRQFVEAALIISSRISPAETIPNVQYEAQPLGDDALMPALANTICGAMEKLAKHAKYRIREASAALVGPSALFAQEAAPLLTKLCIYMACRDSDDAVRHAYATALGDLSKQAREYFV